MKQTSIINMVWMSFLIFIPVLVNTPTREMTSRQQVGFKNQPKYENQENDALVVLQPFGDFPLALSDSIANRISWFYGLPVKVLPVDEMPVSAWYLSRKRYHADKILTNLRGRIPTSSRFIMGLTDKDISCYLDEDHPDWGIFGYGDWPGKTSVVSSFRLKKITRNGQKFDATESLITERLIKVALHELGHNIGLDHCKSKFCLMEDAEGTIVSVDKEPMELCDDCRSRVEKKLKGK